MPKPEMVRVVSQALTMFHAAGLANAREVTPQLTAIWASVLETAGMPVVDVQATAVRLLSTAKFFPTPAEFLQAWKPAEDEDAAVELAWHQVLRCVRRWGRYSSLRAADVGGDGRILWALNGVGWVRLCQELGDENRALLRAEFVRNYRAARATGATLEYVPGLMELENGRKGRDLTPALVGRPDWRELPARDERPTPQLGAVLKSLPAA